LLAQAEKVIEVVKQRDPETARAYAFVLTRSKNAEIEVDGMKVSERNTGVEGTESEGFKYKGKSVIVGDSSSEKDPSTR
jgi:hypothetical protein